jgi:iron complex outermembrane receptor protein
LWEFGMGGFKSGLFFSVGLIALATANVALADKATGAADLDEVVVTASPLGVAEKALTASVDVIDEKQLSRAPAVSLGDLVAGLPGVRSSSFAPGASRPVIRGLSGPRVQVLTNGMGMIDASAISDDHQVAVDPSEADRIEVVRGPATLAYGGSAIGGVVNIIDSRIPDTPARGLADGRFNAQASSVDDGWSASGKVKVGEGPWVFTAQGVRRETGDYSIPGPAMSQALANALGVARTGPDVVKNSYSELSEYGAGASYVTGVGFAGASVKQTKSTYGTVAEPDVSIQLKQTRVDARGELDYDLGPFDKIRASAGYTDYEHTEFEGSEVGTRFLSTGVEGRVELVQRTRGAWQGAVGFQALKRDFEAIGDEALIPPVNIQEYGTYTVQRIDRGKLGLEAGLRVDHKDLDTSLKDRSFDNVSGSLGVFVRPTEGLYVGLTAGRFERAPNEIELFANGPHPATGQYQIGNDRFSAEVANSLEFAVHYSRDRFNADLHIYGAKYDGFIDLRPNGVIDAGTDLPVFQFVQTDATFHGFELEAGYDLWRGEGGRSLRLEAVADRVRGDTDLGAPARIPPWSATGRAVYAAPRWDASVEVRTVGKQDRLANYELPTDGYTLINLHGAVRPFGDRQIELYAEIHNLTDQEAREHASALKDIAPMPGRNVRAGVSYRF